MKKIGFFVLVIGLVGLIATLGMDTTVASSHGYDRIHNIGLMNEKQNFLLVSVAIAIAGVVVLVFGYRSEPSGQSSNKVPVNTNQATRTCPFCAEQIMAQAVLCRYCGRDINPLNTSASESAPTSALPATPAEWDKVSRSLRQVEDSLRVAFAQMGRSKGVNSVLAFATRLEEHLSIIALALLAVGLIAFVYFWIFADYSSWGEHASTVRIYRLQDTSSIFFAGLFLILRKALGKPSGPGNDLSAGEKIRSVTTGKSSWLFLGEAIDLVVVQATSILALIAIHRDGMFKTAYVLALLVGAIGYLLIKLGNRVFGYVTILCGALYLVYRHIWFDSLSSAMENLQRTLEEPSLISVAPYIWLLIASAAIPHFRLIRLDNLKYGKLRGDISFGIAGHEIFLPFASALVFSVLWFGVLAAVTYAYFAVINTVF